MVGVEVYGASQLDGVDLFQCRMPREGFDESSSASFHAVVFGHVDAQNSGDVRVSAEHQPAADDVVVELVERVDEA
jgi:hypothetical protein